MLGRDVVQCAELVVGAPPRPVLDRLEHGLELRERDVWGPLGHPIAPGSGLSRLPATGRPTFSAPPPTRRSPDQKEASSRPNQRTGPALISGSANPTTVLPPRQ